MALATFVVVVDNTIMNVSINALVRDLNTTVSGVQAAISLNALIMAAFVLMGGKLAAIYGIKKTFLFGCIHILSEISSPRLAGGSLSLYWDSALYRALAQRLCCRMFRRPSVNTSKARPGQNHMVSWAASMRSVLLLDQFSAVS